MAVERVSPPFASAMCAFMPATHLSHSARLGSLYRGRVGRSWASDAPGAEDAARPTAPETQMEAEAETTGEKIRDKNPCASARVLR